MSGKRIRESAFPNTRRLFSGVGCNCCLWASASAQRTAAPKRRTSRTPSVSLSRTATRVSAQEGTWNGLFLTHFSDCILLWYLSSWYLRAIPRSISVKPSAASASAVFLSIFSKQRLASWGSSKSRAWKQKEPCFHIIYNRSCTKADHTQ